MSITVHRMGADQAEQWDRAIADFPQVHPLNAYGWGQVRRIDGWDPDYLVARREQTITGMMQVLTKKIPGTGLSVMYAPKGPVWDPNDQETLDALIDAAKQKGRSQRAIFLRIDPNLNEGRFAPGGDPFEAAGLRHLEQRWTFWNSPRDVYRIDLRRVPDEEALFNTLDRDARRCVRKAGREGVEIRAAKSLDELKAFYLIFREFSAGKGFLCRKLEYQEALWRQFLEKGLGRLFLAIYREKVIGGLICLMFAGRCLAMHMGTPYEYQKLQTYYAYVWESMRWAKEHGCHWYSFRGVGTTPAQENFKRKFQPKVVSLVGYYDLPMMGTLYAAMNSVEFYLLPFSLKSVLKIRKNLLSLGGRSLMEERRDQAC